MYSLHQGIDLNPLTQLKKEADPDDEDLKDFDKRYHHKRILRTPSPQDTAFPTNAAFHSNEAFPPNKFKTAPPVQPTRPGGNAMSNMTECVDVSLMAA